MKRTACGEERMRKTLTEMEKIIAGYIEDANPLTVEQTWEFFESIGLECCDLSTTVKWTEWFRLIRTEGVRVGGQG